MGIQATPPETDRSIEEALRLELALGDRAIATTRPVLRHLLAGDNHALLGDDVVARTRGLITDCAQALLLKQAGVAGAKAADQYAQPRLAPLAQALLADSNLVAHAHAQVFEAALAERLRVRSGIDPVLAPVLRDAMIAGDEVLARDAMAALTAQARFIQRQKRTSLVPDELPADLLHRALLLLESSATGEQDTAAAKATAAQVREGFDEGAARAGHIARFLTALGSTDALAVEKAGLAIFASALAIATGQERDTVVLSFADGQFARLALTLRAAGLDHAAMHEQFLYLHPDIALPGAIGALDTGRARHLLDTAQAQAAL